MRATTVAGDVRIGTSGWNYKHWRGPFYPRELIVAKWFAHYAQFFDTVEINNTFYRLPAAEVFVEWRKQAPDNFLYAVKVSRYLTHQKKLSDPEAPLENILGRARGLEDHLGPLLYQLPPRWHCNVDKLRNCLKFLPRDLRHVFEFRDASWYAEPVREALAEFGVSFCIHDLRGQACPEWVTGPVVYLRFHGPTERAYAGKYDAGHLERWAQRIDEYRGRGLDVYAYFNNDDRGFAVENALELRALLSETRTK